MTTLLTVVLRDGSVNGIDDITRLQNKLGITGSPTAIYTATISTPDDDRRDAIMASLKNDPRVFDASYQ